MYIYFPQSEMWSYDIIIYDGIVITESSIIL